MTCLEFNSLLKLKVIHQPGSNCENNDKMIYYYQALQYLKTSPKRQIVQSIPTKHFAADRLVSPLLPPQWTWAPGGHITSPYLSSHNQLLLAPKLRPAGGTENRPQAVWGWRRSHSLITFLPRQHSSRQRLQQINLPLTVHLDWINLELGAITAIGRRGYSPNAGCYPALGIKRKSQLLVFPLSLSLQDRLDQAFFSVLITGLSGADIGFSV